MARTKQSFRRAQAQRALRVGTQSHPQHAHHETTLVPATQSAELPAAAAVMPPHEQCQDEAVTQCVDEAVTQYADKAVTQCVDEAVTQCVDETPSNTPTSKPADIALTLETAAVELILSSTPAVSAQQQSKMERKVYSAD